jgi:mRNA-degrading endonuclease RelE of RelBE toxin-antitoxin system
MGEGKGTFASKRETRWLNMPSHLPEVQRRKSKIFPIRCCNAGDPRSINLLPTQDRQVAKNCKRGGNRWRVRVEDYRVIYAINDKGSEVDVIAIRHRRFVYD